MWHVAKGLSKKLESLGKERQCEAVREWAKSIVNHLYWSVASSSTGEEAVAKWVSVANHVQNVHQHDDWLFPACAHGDLDSDQVTGPSGLSHVQKPVNDWQTSSHVSSCWLMLLN